MNSVKQQVISDALLYSGTTMLVRAIAMVSTFLVANILGPSNFGLWNLIGVILSYGSYFQLGTLSAMQRELPFYIGRNDAEKVEKIRSVVFNFIVISAIVFSLLSIVLAYYYLKSRQFYLVALIVPVIFLQLINLYSQTYLRSINYFRSLCIMDLIYALVFLAAVIILAGRFGVIGLLTGYAVAYVITITYFMIKVKFRIKFNLEYKLLADLIRLGLTIMGLGVINTLLFSLDRMFIAAGYGTKALGYYGMGMTIFALVNIIPGVSSQVIFPRLAEKFGQSNRDVKALKNYLMQPVCALSILLPLFLGFLYYVYPVFINLFLRSFLPSIEIARILMLGVFFVSISGLFSDFLIVVNKQAFMFITQAVTLALSLLLMSCVLWARIDYVYIACVVAASYYIYGTMNIFYSLRKMENGAGQIVREYIVILAPFIYMAILVFILNGVIPLSGLSGVRLYLLQLGIFFLMYSPMLFLVEARTSIISKGYTLLKARTIKALNLLNGEYVES